MWFELQDVSERKIRFTSNLSAKDLMERIEDTLTEMEFRVQKKNAKVSTIASISNILAYKLMLVWLIIKYNINISDESDKRG